MHSARNYWITTHSVKYPSSRPVWGIWDEPRLLFSTGSQIARNISKNSRIQINLESGDELVILEGMATPLQAGDLDLWVSEYKSKYNWDMPNTTKDVFVTQPVRILAWLCDSSGQDGGALFMNTATEWLFEEST